MFVIRCLRTRFLQEVFMGRRHGSRRERAIVIGGSISGLLAARALADSYKKVTLIERDRLEDDRQYRRGVPQAQHAHGILAGGSIMLEKLFPGILDDLYNEGALPSDLLSDARWFFEGGTLRQPVTGITGVLASRPLTETLVRKHVCAINGIEVLDNCAVHGLVFDGETVTGVRTAEQTLDADLVVDASGRGSRTPQWLDAMGFEPPTKEKVEVQLAYTTRLFKRDPEAANGNTVFVVPPTPEGKRGGVVLAQENGVWITTLFGHFGNQAPEDLAGYLRYAKSLAAPYIYDVIRDAEPIGEARFFRFPASTRNRYEKLARFPKGLLVFGDAICSFNPVYGQGMSVAALEADVLRGELLKGAENLAKRFFDQAAKAIDTPWNIAVGSDLRMPETVGPRSLGVKLINWYISKLHKWGHHDDAAAVAFMRVAHLLATPDSLMRPAMVLRVLWADIRSKFGLANSIVGREIASS